MPRRRFIPALGPEHKADLHADLGLERGAGLLLRPGLGDKHELHDVHPHHEPDAAGGLTELQHLVLLQRQVEGLSEQLKQLECACSLFFKGIAERLDKHFSDHGAAALAALRNQRPQTFAVFLLIAQGKTQKEASKVRKVSLKTIQYHWREVCAALNITTYQDATLMAVRSGIL